MIYTFIVAFKDQTRHVLNSMMGYISLPAILQKIMQVNFHWFKKQISGWVASWIYDWIGVGSFRLVIGSGNSRDPLNQSAATSFFFAHQAANLCFLWFLVKFALLLIKINDYFSFYYFYCFKNNSCFLHSYSFAFCTLFIYLLHYIYLPSALYSFTFHRVHLNLFFLFYRIRLTVLVNLVKLRNLF